jgi:hypothetical protein
MRQFAGLLLLLLLTLSSAAAQVELLVNGVRVAGASTTLVPETTSAPAEGLAAALGATLWVDRSLGRLSVTLGAAVLTMALVESPNLVLEPQPALVRDGVALPGPAALWHEGGALLPVKAFGEALGGRVAFLGETQSVALVLPRPRLSAAVVDGERLEFSLDAPGAVRFGFDAEARGVSLFFERADGELADGLDGGSFSVTRQQRSGGGREVHLSVQEGFEPRFYLLPDGPGALLIVAFEPSDAPFSVVPSATRWILDPADGGAAALSALPLDAGALLAQAFVDQLVLSLNRTGVAAQSTRPGPAPVAWVDRMAAAVSADVYVAVHEANLPAGHLRVFVLGDAGDLEVLDRAIRSNAELALDEGSTDVLRRRLLLQLVPDVAFGQRWGSALVAAARAAGWMVEGATEAPLALLAGAGGRGVLLELSGEDLRDPRVAEGLAEMLRRTLPALDLR